MFNLHVLQPGHSGKVQLEGEWGSYLSLNAVFLAYLCNDPSSMMNLIFWKKEAVEDGGWRWRRMSMGLATVVQSWLDLQLGFSQHSGSSQSVSPSGGRQIHFIQDFLFNIEASMWPPICNKDTDWIVIFLIDVFKVFIAPFFHQLINAARLTQSIRGELEM